jgi:hypothetical protein
MLDPLSRHRCRRPQVSVALVLLWAKALSLQAVWAGVAVFSGGFALVSTGLAMLRRDPSSDRASIAGTRRRSSPGCIFLARALI